MTRSAPAAALVNKALVFMLKIVGEAAAGVEIYERIIAFFGDRGTGKAAKGKAVVAIVVVGRIDAAIIEVEVVGVASIRVGSGGPVVAILASVIKLLTAIAGKHSTAPHKE